MQTPLVVHIITRLELGGAQQNTLDSCRLLDRERFGVALLTGAGGQLDAEAAAIAGLDLHLLDDLVREVSPRHDRRAFCAIRDRLRAYARQRTVIVHTHSSKAGILGRLAARAAGIRHVVHTIHGFGHPAFAQPLARRLAIALERHAARHTSRFIAVSRANIDEGTRLGLFRHAKVALIRSAFDVAAFRDADLARPAARARLGLPPDRPLIGTVACLKPQKAPLDFVRAAARLMALRPDAHFAIAGDGELRPAVTQLARELGLGERLHLLGWRDDVPTVLRALDVFWLTSRWEGLPRAVVQAMATGVPVVATAVDGTTDVVAHGTTGFAPAPGDVTAFAAHTLQLLDDAALRERLVANARLQVPDFEVTTMGERLAELYTEMLGAARPPVDS